MTPVSVYETMSTQYRGGRGSDSGPISREQEAAIQKWASPAATSYEQPGYQSATYRSAADMVEQINYNARVAAESGTAEAPTRRAQPGTRPNTASADSRESGRLAFSSPTQIEARIQKTLRKYGL